MSTRKFGSKLLDVGHKVVVFSLVSLALVGSVDIGSGVYHIIRYKAPAGAAPVEGGESGSNAAAAAAAAAAGAAGNK